MFYQDLLIRFAETVKNTHSIEWYDDSDKCAMILDPRYDALMEAVIRNFAYFMNTPEHQWNMVIVSAERYRSEIETAFPKARFMPIHEDHLFYENDTPNITIQTYSQLFLSREMWEALPGKYVATFQKDCFMYKMPETKLYQDYAFVGANWFTPRHVAPKYGGINGGFSIRNRQMMMDCIDQTSWDAIFEYRKIQDLPVLDRLAEDIYYTHACEMLNLPVLPVASRVHLAIEAEYYPYTCVYHGWTKNYHSEYQARRILEECNFPLPPSLMTSEETATTIFETSKSDPEVLVDM